MSDFHVVKVLPRGRVIIDARNLRRLMDRKTGYVFGELLPQDNAENIANRINEIRENDHAIVVPYLAAKPSRRRAVR